MEPTPPKTRWDLWMMIHELFGLKLAHRPFTAGHTSPFAFLADAYLHPEWDVAA